MRNDSIAAALCAALLVPLPTHAAPAQNQTATTGKVQAVPAQAPSIPVSDTVAVPVWPKAAVTLPVNQPIAASFALGAVEGINPALLSGVTAKGYARKVEAGPQTVGQVLVTSVAKGEREETISTEGLTAQFDAKGANELFPEKTLEVKGSKSALIAALERLAKAEKKDEAKKPASDGSVRQGSDGGRSNDLASQYRTPATVAPTPTPEKKTTTEVRTSTEGCRVRVDLAQGKAIRQSKEQTFTDGVLAGESQCTDSDVSFPLKKSYGSCPIDIVDLTVLKAWPQYSLTYLDEAGETHAVSECAKDEETPYTISEDESQCAVFLDFATKQAVPQAALVYLNRNNVPVQVRGCGPSTKSAPLPMRESVEACPLRHDFNGGTSAELSMWTYVRDGITYQAAPCTDTGRIFAHETVYADASGAYICPTVTDLDRRTVTLQSRKRITIDGAPRFITECSPDSAAQAIISTSEGCTDPGNWTHDIEAGQSYGQERFYYLRPNGSREYVTACQTSSVTYRHQQAITGYQNHDDQLWAYPLSTVTIDVAGKPYVVVASEVLPGSAQLAYLPQGEIDTPTGAKTTEGCNAWTQTARSERWKRPDGTEYLKPIGAGTPQGPVNACIDQVEETRAVATGWYGLSKTEFISYGSEGAQYLAHKFSYCTAMQNVNKINRVNSITGEVVSTTCKFPGDNWIGWCLSSGEPTVNLPREIAPYAYTGTTQKQTLFIPPCPF